MQLYRKVLHAHLKSRSKIILLHCISKEHIFINLCVMCKVHIHIQLMQMLIICISKTIVEDKIIQIFHCIKTRVNCQSHGFQRRYVRSDFWKRDDNFHFHFLFLFHLVMKLLPRGGNVIAISKTKHNVGVFDS